MANELATRTSHLNSWQAHQVGVLVPELVEAARWDKLLGELGITEHEALEAIVNDGYIGRSIRRFVRESCRHHFVPEDVLIAMKLQQEAAQGAIFS
jgi:hypothetical protein